MSNLKKKYKNKYIKLNNKKLRINFIKKYFKFIHFN